MNDNINVILTVWKRDNLKVQLDAIQNQTANINEIYVYQNESHVDINYLKKDYKFNHVHSVDVNFKFHGRFTLPLLFNSLFDPCMENAHYPVIFYLLLGLTFRKYIIFKEEFEN